jgi:WD40 repeat protein
VAFSPDGKNLAAAAADQLILWDVASRQPRARHKVAVHSVAFSPDGKFLAVTDGNEVILWDVVSWLPLARHKGDFRRAAFSPDGRILATGGNEVILWDVASWLPLGGPIGRLMGRPQGGIYSIAFSPDGKAMAAGYSDGRGVGGVILYDVDPESWQRRACRIANRNLSWDEWIRFIGRDVPYGPICPDFPIPPEPPTSLTATKAPTGSTEPATLDRR